MESKDDKNNPFLTLNGVSSSEKTEEIVAPKWRGTQADQQFMTVIGRPQQLRRNFQFFTILGFGCTLISTWEINITTFGLGLTNGGAAGIIYGFITVVVGYGFVYASLAEMASMSPTAGGQYHWISEFSPPSCQKFLSYISGWLCLTGWQAAISAMAFLTGTMIQALIILHHPSSYDPQPWHGTLLTIGIILISGAFNILFAKHLPLIEGIILVIHVIGLFAIAIPLLVLSPSHKPASQVFTEFNNEGGWSTTGVAFLIGLLPLSASVGGIDCVVHMAEEVKDAGKVLPRSLMLSLPINALLGFIMLLTLCFCTVDVEGVMNSPVGIAGYPFIQIIYTATGRNLAATTVLVVLPVLSLTGSVVAEVATASRQMWSFARDGGVPFSRFIAKVYPEPAWAIPLNAVVISLLINCSLSLINIGSTAALNAIFSLSGVSILSSYIICIGSVLVRRIRYGGASLPARSWTLPLGEVGGRIVNFVALGFLVPLCVFCFFPPGTPATAGTMNWGSLMYGGVVFFAGGYYLVYGRDVYTPPVDRLRRDRTGVCE